MQILACVSVGRQSFERFQSSAKIVDVDEVTEAPSEWMAIVAVEALDGRVLFVAENGQRGAFGPVFGSSRFLLLVLFCARLWIDPKFPAQTPRSKLAIAVCELKARAWSWRRRVKPAP